MSTDLVVLDMRDSLVIICAKSPFSHKEDYLSTNRLPLRILPFWAPCIPNPADRALIATSVLAPKSLTAQDRSHLKVSRYNRQSFALHRFQRTRTMNRQVSLVQVIDRQL